MHVFKKITRRNFILTTGALSFFLSTLLFYYALIISEEELLSTKTLSKVMRGKTPPTFGAWDMMPGVLMMSSYLFMLPWNGRGGTRPINAPTRTGGPCSPDCVKIFLGGGLFAWGLSWGLLFVAIHRFLWPRPTMPHPVSVAPGIYYMLHILLLVYTGYSIFMYTSIPPGDRTPALGDDEE